MADTLSVELRASLVWLFQDAIDLTTITDASRLDFARTLTDGTGADQADKLWHDQRSVAAGANDDLDLTALAQTIFGSAVTIGLARVKALLIVNLAAVAGEDLLVGGAGAGAFAAPFNDDADATLQLTADSALLLTNKKSGWIVDPGVADVLRISSTGLAPITYRIAIVGTGT